MADSYTKILIVDDEPEMLSLLYSLLRDNYIVFTATTGEQALKKAKVNAPDLILLDILMPGMDGFEVLKELKSSAITRGIPVIFLTALDSANDEEEGIRLGAVDYIFKPFNITVVLARVERHLEVSRRLLESDGREFLLKFRQGVRRVLFRELMYIEVKGHWLSFHLSDGEQITICATLKGYGDLLLSDTRFARCHKSFIVNMDFVTSVETREQARSVILKNGTSLPLSKRHSGFKKLYAEWIHG